MISRRTLCALAVAALAVAGCGGGDGNKSDDASGSAAEVLAAWTLMSPADRVTTCELVDEFGAAKFAAGLNVDDVDAAAEVLEGVCG